LISCEFFFLKGFALFRAVEDNSKYINDRYYSILDFLLNNSILTKLFVFCDVWFRSFLFRATFILDMIFMLSLENEIWKRQQILTDLVILYAEKLSERRISLSKDLINKFRVTCRRLRDLILNYDSISGPSIIVVILFFIMYLLTDINSFVANENTGNQKIY